MSQNAKLFIHDLRNILCDRKTVLLLIFLTSVTLIIGASISLALHNDSENLLNQLKMISNIGDVKVFSSYIIYIFSFIIFSAYPFILGILIISYIKEFGELELMMLLPINRKCFFIGKIFCIFIVSLIFSWISILINLFIQSIILDITPSFDFYKFFYTVVSLPVWLFSLSCLTVIISSLSKDSKEANQRSLILVFILYCIIQILLVLKINIFSPKTVFIPSVSGSILLAGLLHFSRKRLSIERILYA